MTHAIFNRFRARGKALSPTGGRLRQQVIRGSMWLIIGDVLGRGSGLLRAVILSRLLAPRDFGLLGVALLVQRLIESFTETGITTALIQKRGDIADYLDTAWTIQAIRGVFICLLLILIAPFAGAFFNNSQAPAVVRCMGIMTLLWGLNNPAVILLRRDLRFKADVTWRSSGFLPGLIVAVSAGYYLRNAWALVLALLVGRLAETTASYCVQSYRPRPRIRWRLVRELMQFGRWVSFSNMLAYWENQVDSLVIGRLLGTTQLGYYQVAGQLANPLARLGGLLEAVLFPALSRLDSEQQLRRVFLSCLRVLASSLIPLGILLNIVTVPLVTIVLGAKWRPSCAAFESLVWAAIAMAVAACTAPALLSIGKPRRLVEAQLLRLLCLGAAVYPLLRVYGIAGVALAVALASLVSTGTQIVFVVRHIHASATDVMRAFRGAAAASVPLLIGKVMISTQHRWLCGMMLLLGFTIYSCILKEIIGSVFAGFRLSDAAGPAPKLETQTIHTSAPAEERV